MLHDFSRRNNDLESFRSFGVISTPSIESNVGSRYSTYVRSNCTSSNVKAFDAASF